MTIRIDEPIGVLGIGVEGRATVDYLVSKGAKDITALDRNEVEGLLPQVSGVFGPDHDKGLERFATIFRSPGIRPDHPSLVTARRAGSRITSATSFFLEHCPAPVVGITGTLGKGTVAALTASLLEASGFNVHLGGNIGKSPLDFLNDVKPGDRVVLEVSSFQAMDLNVSPHVGVVLKTTSEHLDWHADVREYRAAKSRLFDRQTPNDTLIFNMDSEGAEQVARAGRGRRLAFSLRAPVENGIFLDGDRMVRCEEGRRAPLDIDLRKIRLPGRFNLENIAAAVTAAVEAGASLSRICPSVEIFEGLPHRLQYVTQSDRIRFFNDSYATRPEAALGAISAFEDTPLAVILGGSEKFADFSELARAMRRHPTIKYAALIGLTAPRLSDALQKDGPCPFSIEIHDGLEPAVEAAAKAVSVQGGVVLMSPACASFGLFANYKARGECFIKAAHRTAAGYLTL